MLVNFITFSLCVGGLFLISLSMQKHYKQFSVAGKLAPLRRKILKHSGYLLLVCSLIFSYYNIGLELSLVGWVAWLTISQFLVATFYTYK